MQRRDELRNQEDYSSGDDEEPEKPGKKKSKKDAEAEKRNNEFKVCQVP